MGTPLAPAPNSLDDDFIKHHFRRLGFKARPFFRDSCIFCIAYIFCEENLFALGLATTHIILKLKISFKR